VIRYMVMHSDNQQ